MRFDFSTVPAGATTRGVDVEAATIDGKPALRLALDAATRAGTAGVDFVDQPTFLLLPIEAAAGRLSVSVRAGLLPDAPEYARGFAGLAFRATADSFESVYLRPTNGLGVAPEGVRRERAVQYFAYPDWPFDRLREERPSGGYEAGADISPDMWARLSVEFGPTGLRAHADDVLLLDLDHTLGVPLTGAVGLWVDIGTEAFFADLEVEVHG